MNALLPALPQAAARPSHSADQAHAEAADATLTNQTILAMVRARVGAKVIINSINTSPGRYALDPKSLVQLSTAGVPEAVIEAMQAHGGDTATASAVHAAPAVKPTAGWITSVKADRFTGAKTVIASRVFAADAGASIVVNATCQNDPAMLEMMKMPGQFVTALGGFLGALTNGASNANVKGNPADALPASTIDPRSLDFDFQYAPARGSHAAFAVSSSPVTVAITKDAFQNSATATRQGGVECVPLRISVDGVAANNPKNGCGSTRVPEVKFLATSTGDAMGDFYKVSGAGGTAVKIGQASGQAVSGGIALMPDAIKARKILVDLPLNDGHSNVVEIEPQEADFREFVSKCMEVFPKPAGSVVFVASAADAAAAQKDADDGMEYARRNDYARSAASFKAALVLDKNNAVAQAFLPKAEHMRDTTTVRPGTILVPLSVSMSPDNKRMWMRQDNGEDVDFQQANQYCGALNVDGLTGWRLPTSAELAPLRGYGGRKMAPSKIALHLDDGPQIRTYPVGTSWSYAIYSPITLTGPAEWISDPGKDADHQITFLGFINYGNEPRVSSAKDGIRALCTRDVTSRDAAPVRR